VSKAYIQKGRRKSEEGRIKWKKSPHNPRNAEKREKGRICQKIELIFKKFIRGKKGVRKSTGEGLLKRFETR